MEGILRIITNFGFLAIFVTPLTLVIGLINAIKKPENEALPYKAMAIVSAYLIFMPIIYPILKFNFK